jgi:putative addiction module antidote
MFALKVRKIGGAKGVILPKEALARLKVDEGDKLYLTEAPDGYRVTAQGPEFEEQMTAMRKAMKDWRPVLRQLAK